MNKTYNINLGGIPFQIDDVAFERLNAYLLAVKQKFASVNGKNEIVEDIEARIAEMFQENLKASSRTIVSTKDVDGAISTMGKPEEFDQGYTDTESNSSTGSTYKTGRRLYRDTDDKVLGGVISGVTKYFGFNDPTWFRVALILLPIFDWLGLYISTGIVIITYFVLWIVVPKAQTATEKMQMRGEAVNLDNIEKSFNDELDNVKKNLSSENRNSFFNKLGHLIVQILKGFAKLLLIFGLAALGFLILGLIITFLCGAFGIGLASPFLTQHIFGNGWMSWAAIIGLLLISLAPAIFFITLFIKLLFKTKTHMPAIAITALGAFIVGILLSATSIGTVIQDFSTKAKASETTGLYAENGLLTIYGNENASEAAEKFLFFGDDDNSFKIGEDVDFRLLSTLDSTARISVQKTVRGKNDAVAKERLNHLIYKYKVDSGKLTLNSYFILGKEKLWRGQEVDISLHVPENTLLTFDDSFRKVLHNGIRINDDFWTSGNKYFNHKYWKIKNNRLVKVDENGTEIIEDDNISSETDTIANREHVEIKLFGEQLLTVDIDEKNENGKAERVRMKLGDKQIFEIEVDEDGDVVHIDNDFDE